MEPVQCHLEIRVVFYVRLQSFLNDVGAWSFSFFRYAVDLISKGFGEPDVVFSAFDRSLVGDQSYESLSSFLYEQSHISLGNHRHEVYRALRGPLTMLLAECRLDLKLTN